MKYLLALFLALGLNAKSQNYDDSIFLHGFLMDSAENVCQFDTIKIQRLYVLYSRSDQTDLVGLMNIRDEMYEWMEKLVEDNKRFMFEAGEVIRFADLKKPRVKND